MISSISVREVDVNNQMAQKMAAAVRGVLGRWPMELLGALLLAISVGVVAYTYQSSERVVRQYATESAKTHADSVTQFRNFYTLELVPRAVASGMAVTHDYRTRDHALPLPATLTIELGHYLSKVDGGTQVSLYSDQPFPWREKERRLDDFQREALQHLQQHPDQPYVREEWRDGERVLRYAQADRMLERCVACHNSYPGSPRTDWKTGDVRGALEVVLPVSQWQLASTGVLNRTFTVLLLVLLVGLLLIWLSVRRIRLALATSRQLSSEREQAIRHLRLSESKLNSIFSAVPDAIVVANQAGVVVQCNPAVAQIFGYTVEELMGQNVRVLMDSEQSASHDGHLQRYLQSGQKRMINQPRLLQGCRRDGRAFPVRLTISETRVDEEHFFIALIQDYTAVQQAQDMLVEARDRAEQANRLRGEFLANMSHEIRTPMNGIVGMTELAMGTSEESARKEYLTLARDSANHLLHIINEILDFSKIEARALELQPQWVSPAQLVRHTARSLEPLAHAKGLAFRVEMDEALTGMALLDPVRIRQVLTNLIGNAIKFTQEGGVTVQASLNGTSGAAQTLIIRISDTGIGFDPARTEALFSPFTQADGSITRSFGGTGLGLAITRSLVHLMGGQVTAHSLPGEGACFVVRIPLQMVAQPLSEVMQGPAAYAAVVNTPAHRSLSVLLVEDHAINRKLAEILLQRMGHRHVAAGDGQQALDRLAEQDFDVVLMDVMMPNMDGVTALGLLRAREADTGRHTPVLMVTAHAMTGDRERFLAAGADGYVSKPLSPDELCKEIDRVVAQTWTGA